MHRLLKLLATAALAALPASQVAQAASDASAEAPLYMLDYSRASDTPEGAAKLAVARIRQAVDWAVPKDAVQKSLDVKVEYPKDAPSRVSAFTVKGSEVRILVGGPLETLPDDAEALRRITATLLLARCGLMAESLDDGYPEWLATGIARGVVSDLKMPATPGGLGYPGSIALSSAGSLPDLRAVVAGPLEPSDGACYEIYAELCQILVTTCARSGLSQKGALKKVVCDAARKDGPGRYTSFIDACAEALAKGKEPKDQKSEKDVKRKTFNETSAQISELYSTELKRSVRNCFTPLSARLAESVFKEAAKIKYKAADGSQASCELDDLAAKKSSIVDFRLAVAEARARLAELSNESPEDLQPSLWELQTALGEMALAPGKPSGEAVATAKRHFYESLESRISFEATLKLREREKVPPCVRFGGTLAALKGLQAWEEAPYAKEAAFLDEWTAKNAGR